jgi:hypothetical protein
MTYRMGIKIVTEKRSASRPTVRDIVAQAPNPHHPLLDKWVVFADKHPHVLRRMEATIQRTRPERIAMSRLWGAAGVRLPVSLSVLYSRALIMRNPGINGRLLVAPGAANGLLGCTTALEHINGEPFCRLVY